MSISQLLIAPRQHRNTMSDGKVFLFKLQGHNVEKDEMTTEAESKSDNV